MHFEYNNQTVEILYEDNHLLVVDKPVGMLSQADQTGELDLLSFCKHYLKVRYQKTGNVYLGLVHRLDRPVSGVMVFAKTSKAASRLSDQIRKHKWVKIYYAVCEGVLQHDLNLEQYLFKDTSTNKVSVSNTYAKGAKQASLKVRLLQSKNQLSLVEVDLESGRSHQIRAQLSAAGIPIWADIKYGAKRHPKAMDLALRSTKLSFPHPVKDQMMQFQVELPYHKKPWNEFNDQ